MNEFNDYVANKDNVIESDRAAGRIDSMGAYVGKFDQVRYVKASSTGSHGMRFYFDSSDGKAVFTLWIRSADGKDFSNKTWLDCMMTVLKVNRLESETRKVDQKGENVEVVCYKSLENKEIGIILSHTITEDNNDDFKVAGVFDPKTNLTAKEIETGVKEPKAKDRIVKGLRLIDKRGLIKTEISQTSMSDFEGM